jgi:integrase
MSFTTVPHAPTLRNVFDAVSACASMSAIKKRDTLSAIRTVGRAIGSDLEWISAEPAQLGRALADVAPAASGMSVSRLNNVRSLVNKAVALSQPMLPLRQDEAASPAWEHLLGQLEPRYQRYAVLPGLKHLTTCGIEPDAVTADDLHAYLEQVKASLRKKPVETCRRFIKGWNAGRAEVVGWPDIPLIWESRRQTRALGWETFPASYKADVEAWLARQGGDDLMAEDGPPKPLKPVTLNHYRGLSLIFASSLVEQGTPAENIRSLADLVTIEAFKKILRAELERSGNKATATIAKRADILISLARHYVKIDERELDALRKNARRVKPEATGMTDKNRARLRQFPNLESMRPLLAHPFLIRRRLDRQVTTSVRDSQLAMAAVAVAILLVAPIRIKNLRMIQLDQNIVRRGKVMQLVIPREDVKNGVPIEMTIPQATADLVDWFIATHRKNLPGAGSRYLFGGMKDGPRSECGMSEPINKLLKRELGLTMNPHLFRSFAALLFLSVHPGQYEVVRQLLGHKSIVTTMKHYAGFETNGVAALYHGVIDHLLKGGVAA